MRALYGFLLLLAALLISSCSSGPDTHRLTTTSVPSEAGSVTPAEGEFTADETFEIGAYANEHWVFERWEGDLEGTKNPVIINMDSDKDIAAIFAKRQYPLTITVQGVGTVSERLVQSKVETYEQGTIIELTATPATDWEFKGWKGDIESTENPVEVTIDGETEITAVFEGIGYPLTVNVVGEGSVTEEIVQAKTTEYPIGTALQLTAVPDSGWTFLEWEGAIQGVDNPVQITMDEPKTVTATFEKSFTLTTLPVPADGGTIEPSGGEYIRDTSFEVEAIPNEGWRFVEWRGDFTGTTNPFNLTMNGNKTLEAHFEIISIVLQTNADGNGDILTTVLSGGETADGYELNSEVEITAFPDEGWQFIRWEGSVTGTANPTTVIMDAPKSVTAVFRIFDGGTGTMANPYQVSTLYQLQRMSDFPDSYFILMQDINASATAGWNGGEGFEPIGNSIIPFAGGFDGNGFTISNLSINRTLTQYVGLFGYTDVSTLIQNVRLSNADITGNSDVGAIAGLNNGEITKVYSTGSVSGSDNIGGVAGSNNGTMQETASGATITSTSNSVGGLVGTNTGTISNSNAVGSVSGNTNAGGLIGTNTTTGTVSLTFAAGSVSAVIIDGGLIGGNNGSVSTSYWDTQATAQASGTGSGDATGMTGLTSAQMTGEAADDAGNMDAFDWVNIWSTGTGYPFLRWITP